MSDPRLVLSLFSGAGLFDEAFRELGYCVVSAGDVLWGEFYDIHHFHPVPGVFAGVIGGSPCQLFTRLRHLNPLAGQKHGNLIPEFARCVMEAQPSWFVMENVPDAPAPETPGYELRNLVLNNRWLGEAQDRTRRFTFGTRDGRELDISPSLAAFECVEYRQAVTSSLRAVPVKLGGTGKVKRTYTEDGKRHGPSIGPRAEIQEMCHYQGLPDHWMDEMPFTEKGKRQMLGNGVPLPMGRAIARAVKAAMEAH